MELKQIVEALLFSAQKALSTSEIRDVLAAAADQGGAPPEVKAFKKTRESDLTEALGQLAAEHEQAGRTYRLTCVAGAWQFVTQPEFAPWLKALVGVKARPSRLSQPALETLAIIAYRQPITRAGIEQIRGVSVDGVMQTLLDRGLIEQVGRAEVVGHPMNYATTRVFLEYFGLRSLEDLPAAGELRAVVVERPPAPLTADPGLATVPPAEVQGPGATGDTEGSAPQSHEATKN